MSSSPAARLPKIIPLPGGFCCGNDNATKAASARRSSEHPHECRAPRGGEDAKVPPTGGSEVGEGGKKHAIRSPDGR